MPAGNISPMFILSKLLSAVTQPMFWLVLWRVLTLLMLKRWRGPAVTMTWGGLAVRCRLSCGFTPMAELQTWRSAKRPCIVCDMAIKRRPLGSFHV